MHPSKLFYYLFFILTTTQLSQTVNENNLIVHYSFDGNTLDASPNILHGEVIGAQLTTDRYGNPNSAYYFDGVDDYIDMGYDSRLKPMPPVTISCWIKFDAVEAGIFSNDIHDTRYYGIFIPVSTNNNISLQVGNGELIGPDSRKGEMTSTPGPGEWFHFVGVLDQSLNVQLYINGKKVQSTSVGYGSSLVYSTGKCVLGLFDNGQNEPPEYLTGKLDDFRMYNRILSDSEIYQLFNPNISQSDLIVHYTFDDNANDSSPNHIDGQVIGAQLTKDRLGKPNSAYYFDGENDYIDLGYNPLLKPNSPISISCWVKYETLNQLYPIFGNDFHDTRYYGIKVILVKEGFLYLFYGDGGKIGPKSRTTLVVTPPDAYEWFHFAGLIKENGTMKIYINGEEVAGTYEGWGGELTYAFGNTYIGKSDHAQLEGPKYFKGWLDDFRLYNRVLTEGEIKEFALFDPEPALYLLSIDTISIVNTEEVIVPVKVDIPYQTEFSSFELKIDGFQNYAEFSTIVNDESTIISDDWTISTNETGSGLLIAGASGDSFGEESSGNLLKLKFTLNNPILTLTIPLNITSAVFDGGATPVNINNGAIIILDGFIYGDIDFDGVVRAFDASHLLKYLVGEIELDQAQLVAADVSLDSTVSAYDASLILDYVTEKITVLPYEAGSAQPEPSGRFSMPDVQVTNYEEVVIPIDIESAGDIISLEGEIVYDPDILSFDHLEVTQLLENNQVQYKNADGKIKFASFGSKIVGEKDRLFNIVFKTKSEEDFSTNVYLNNVRLNEEDVIEQAAVSKLTLITGLDETDQVPLEFSLEQNYPNPFNPGTTQITYTIPETGLVTLKIYDTLGQLISTLVNETKNAGKHFAFFNAQDLNSGVYIYSISVGDYRATRKMLYIK